jgi:sugar phosphate isomerase/epimerase
MNDNLTANVELLKDSFDVIQLLFYDRNGLDDVMSAGIIKRLAEIKNSNNISYIIHLPINLDLFSSAAEFEKSAGIINSIISATADIKPEYFILHLDGACDSARLDDVLGMIRRMDPYGRVLVENTGFDLLSISGPLARHGFGICMDIGHIYMKGHDMNGFLAIFGDRIRVVHLHGFDGARDHISLRAVNPAIIKKIVTFLGGYTGIMIIEVYSYQDLEESVKILKNSFGS